MTVLCFSHGVYRYPSVDSLFKRKKKNLLNMYTMDLTSTGRTASYDDDDDDNNDLEASKEVEIRLYKFCL